MSKRLGTVLLALLVSLQICLLAPPPAEGRVESLSKPLRVVLWEAGPFHDHQLLLQGMIEQLQAVQAIQILGDGNIPQLISNDIAPLWDWLAIHAGGGKILFHADGFYSANWQEEQRARIKKALALRLSKIQDVDVILAFDTWSALDAIQLVREFGLTIPVLAASVTSKQALLLLEQRANSQKAGQDAPGSLPGNMILIQEEHHTARLAALFHRLFGFAGLGIVYEDSPEGRAMAGVDDLELAAGKRGFTLVPCTPKLWGEDAGLVHERILACHKELVQKQVDAVFLTNAPGKEGSLELETLLQPLIEAGLPVFSQHGGREVEAGALLGTGTGVFSAQGRFLGSLLAALAAGKPLAEVDTAFVAAGSFALNLGTALTIGWDPPLGVLAITDEYVDTDGVWQSALPRP